MPGQEMPNVFLLLGLDPAKAGDRAACLQRLEEKRKEWSRNLNNVLKVAQEAKRNLGWYSEIKRILESDEERRAQAKAAIQDFAQARSADVQRFTEALAVSEARGYVLEDEVARWVKTYVSALSEQEIRQRIKAPIRAATPAPKVNRAPQLNPTVAKAIHEQLALVGEESLYSLLANTCDPTLRPSSPRAALQAAAAKLYDDMLNQRNKDAFVTAKSDLAGHAKVIFDTDEKRREYDETLRRAPFDALLQRYAEACAPSGAISAEQADLFLHEARKLGWKVDEAQAELLGLAQRNKWLLTLSTTTVETVSQQRRCGNPPCHRLNPPDRKFCQVCGWPLIVECPNCQRRDIAADEDYCPACGFHLFERFWVRMVLDETRRLVTENRPADARVRLENAKRVWAPKHPDDLAREIAELFTRAQRQEREVDEASARLDELVKSKRFFAARELLASLPASLRGREARQRAIGAAIAEAEGMFRRAKQPDASPDRRADLCVEALDICVDYAEPRQLLERMPPEAPRELRVTTGERLVKLEWSPSPTRNSFYVVVRKVGSAPVSPNDGTRLQRVAGCSFDDTQPEMGVSLFYTVFADRGFVHSARGAAATRSVLLLEDVTALAQQINDRMVELTWEPPRRAQRIIVTRTEAAPPRSHEDGVARQPVDNARLVDHDVANGRRYFYGVFSQFTDAEGRVRISRGAFIEATPEVPPVPPDIVCATSPTPTGFDVRITWTPPIKGDVVIVRSPASGSRVLRAGETLRADALADYGQVLQGTRQLITDTRSSPGVSLYTPVVIFQRTAYVGVSRRCVAIADAHDLKAHNLGASIQLTWAWPEGCFDALVTFDRTGWPEAGVTLTATTLKVTRAEYERLGYYNINGTGESDYFIVVGAVVKSGDETIVGSGARVRVRLMSKMTIEYEIRPPARLFGSKRFRLFIRTQGVATLPALLVRSKRHGLPINSQEGELVHRVAAADQPIREVEIELPERKYPPDTFGKLFLEDESAHDYVKIYHPDREKLRLSV